MVNRYNINEKEIVLKSDLAAEFPIYIYVSKDKKYALYSKSITELLNDSRVVKPLKVTNYGLSFLLQSGVVPPPRTAYKNVYICSIGDTIMINTKNNQVNLKFDFAFPFLHKNRLDNSNIPNEDYILEIMAEATISKIDNKNDSFLFHSAGKDSNTIALSLAHAGWQDQVTLISHKSKGEKDESEISKQVAKKLGFKHQVLYETDKLEKSHFDAIENYFINAPMPSIDNVSLAYPLYTVQMAELHNSNLIDGMGNDIYIGHIPALPEYKRQDISKYLKYARSFTKYSNSENILNVIARTRSEWCGMFGLSYKDTKNILGDTTNVYRHWLNRDNELDDYLDFRPLIRGGVIDPEIFTRKIRNFSDSINASAVLPFTNEKVAKYFSELPEKYLFDRKELKNKLILRELLKKHLDLDSDKLGKLSYSFDSRSLVLTNWNKVKDEILSCKYWDKNGIEKLINRFEKKKDLNQREGGVTTNMIYRLYLISSWLNKSKYLN